MPIQAWPGGRHGDRLHRWFQMTHISIGGIESPPRGKLYHDDCVDLDLGLGPNEVIDAETRASEVQKIAQAGGRSRGTVSSSSTRIALPVLVSAARSRGTHIPLLVWGAEMFLCGNV